MNRIKYGLRGLLLLLIILQLIHLNNKTDNALGKIVKFKMETLHQIQADSIDAEGKLDSLIDKTTKFTRDIQEESPSIKRGMNRLMGILAIFVVAELVFFVTRKARSNIA